MNIRWLRLHIYSALLTLVAACASNSPTAFVPDPDAPCGFSFEPPLPIGPGTLFERAEDLVLTIQFSAPIDSASLPAQITIDDVEFILAALPEADQLVATVAFVPSDLNTDLLATALTEVCLATVNQPFTVVVTAPSPSPEPSPSPVFSASPTSGSTIDVGGAIVGTDTAPQTLTISNTGIATLEIGAAQLSGANPGDFTISPNTAFKIESSESQQDITITCKPDGLGLRTATLEFNTNDSNQATASFDLECTGMPPAPSAVVNTLIDEDGTGSDTALQCSLREAIIANNENKDFGGCANPEGTIKFATELNGIIKITDSALPMIENSVVIDGPGASTLTVSGENTYRVFEADSNLSTVEILGLTIANGSTSANGGGILAGANTTLVLTNSVLRGNSADGSGGGIHADTATVNSSTISGNSAGDRGGGIYAGVTTVKNSMLSKNSADSRGGGIHANTTIIAESIVRNNSTGNLGGGIRTSTATVTNSTISDNTANQDGGGISATSEVAVVNSTLSGNSAPFGGGIYAANPATAALSNSTLSGNMAGTSGGGIRAVAGATLNNTIVSGNTAPEDSECRGSISGGFNLFGVMGNSGGCPTGGSNIIPASALEEILSPLANNGGFIPGAPGSTERIQTHALPSTSFAIDAGDNSLIPSEIDTDQRGASFDRIAGLRVDIGAFEVQNP